MKYNNIKKLSDAQFHRLTGVQRSTFNLMVGQLQSHHSTKGRPFKLAYEEQLLLCLEYWREYRALFHIATSYGISEPTASRTVCWEVLNVDGFKQINDQLGHDVGDQLLRQIAKLLHQCQR
jgi:GGDEF domain-containing protein